MKVLKFFQMFFVSWALRRSWTKLVGVAINIGLERKKIRDAGKDQTFDDYLIEATNKDFIEKVKILRANLIDYFNHKHPDTYDKNSFNSAGYLSLVLDSDSNEAGSFRICLNLNIPGQKELRCIHVFTYWDVFPKIGSAPIISMVSTINTDSAKNKDHNINYEIEVDGVRRPDYGMAEILDELDNPEIITYLRASDKK